MDFICRERDYFKNPSKVPLNELMLEIKTCSKSKKIPKDKGIDEIKDGLNKFFDIKTEKVPALSSYWIQKKHSYHMYQAYYFEVSAEENKYFLTRNKLFLENLKFLLSCNYHQFWCYIVHEPRIRRLLNSFITNPILHYELKHLTKNYLDMYENVHEMVARVILRLLTFEESNIEYMDEDTVLKHLSKFELLSCARIIDLCVLYGHSNVKLIENLLQISFSSKREKYYEKDVRNALNHALLVFDMVGGHVCGFEDNPPIVAFSIRPKPINFDPCWIEEVVSYILDMTVSLNAFFTSCKSSIKTALSMGIPFRLAFFHDKVYEELYRMMKTKAVVPYDWSALKNKIYEYIALGRMECVNIFHCFTTYLIDSIIQTQNKETQMEHVEQYFKLVLSIFEDELFVYDYHNSKEVDVQLQTISDCCSYIDPMRINYILECLSNVAKPTKKGEKTEEICASFEPTPGTSGKQLKKSTQIIPSADEIEIRIREVLETLPHFGDGFVLKCLEIYNYNPHEVISAILDNNLSPILNDTPQDLIRIPPEPEPEQPILAYKGKKPDYKDAAQLLDDKTDYDDLKAYVLKSSNVYYDIYDDEYDDRFGDEATIRIPEKSEEPDLYKYMENRFEGYDVISDPSSSDEEDDNGNVANGGKPQRLLYEDPAVIRARKEAQRKQSNKSDVVGKPKGQGQDKNVLNNRNKKGVHKSSRANHNRKSGAQWKQSKGMF